MPPFSLPNFALVGFLHHRLLRLFPAPLLSQYHYPHDARMLDYHHHHHRHQHFAQQQQQQMHLQQQQHQVNVWKTLKSNILFKTLFLSVL